MSSSAHDEESPQAPKWTDRALQEMLQYAPITTAAAALQEDPLLSLLGLILAPGGVVVMSKVRDTLQAYEDAGPSIDDLNEAMKEERVASLADRVFRASAETIAAPDKLVGLGRVLAYGLEDDAQFDTAVLLSGALRDLENVHVRILGNFAKDLVPKQQRGEDWRFLVGVLKERRHRMFGNARNDPYRRDFDDLAGFAGGSEVAVVSFLAVAARHGLLEQVGGFGDDDAAWVITSLGWEMCWLLLGENPSDD